jgi:predicted dehydrogenase
VPAEHPHHVLVVGAGSIGERHVRCFLATGRALVSFVEPLPDLRAAVAARYGDARAFASLDAALEGAVGSAARGSMARGSMARGSMARGSAARGSMARQSAAVGSAAREASSWSPSPASSSWDVPVDAAVVATPAPLHVSQATSLVERGVHVLIEKPLAVTTDGVEALLRMTRARGVVAAVAYVYRAHPVLAEMRDAIVRGRFGRPLELIVVAGQHFPTYRPAYRETYYTKHATGGGAVQDALTHIINAGQWLVGPIDRLVADVAHLALEGTAVEDTAHVLARHGDVPASYALNQHQAPNETTITVVCERGTARFEAHTGRWRAMEHPGATWTDHGGASSSSLSSRSSSPSSSSTPSSSSRSVSSSASSWPPSLSKSSSSPSSSPPPLAAERDLSFVRQANAFLDAVEGKAEPLCTLDEGAATLRANVAILQSAGSGRWVSCR